MHSLSTGNGLWKNCEQALNANKIKASTNFPAKLFTGKTASENRGEQVASRCL
jgi:hypothetical protein